MSTTQQPEALRLADKYEAHGFLGDHRFAQEHWCRQAAAELRSQHTRIAELEAQLSAIGAGGVEPLRKRKEPTALAARQREIGEAWMTVFTHLLDDYKQCLLDKDFRDARAARSAVIAEYEQAATPGGVKVFLQKHCTQSKN